MKVRLEKYAAVLILVMLLVLNSVFVVKYLTYQEPWAPLSEYRQQPITNGIEGPGGQPTISISADGVVEAFGVKCSRSTAGIVRVSGTVSWETIDPEGTRIDSGRGTSFRYPCNSTDRSKVEFKSQNIIPSAVKLYSEEFFERNRSYPLWQISGIEIPVRKDQEGVRGVWETGPFYLIP